MGSTIILGASGFIGTRLVHRLAESGRQVHALDLAPPRERAPGVHYRTVDVRRPIQWEHTEAVEAIFNLAAIHRTPGHDWDEYYETNVLGALNAVELAQACGCRTMVFTSSIAVYGPSDEAITEVSPITPASNYGLSKHIAEGVHRGWLEKAGDRRLVIVRPGVVFGPGEGGNYTRLAKALRRGVFAYPGRKTTIKSGGHVDELLSAIEFALGRDEREITFNYAYPDETTMEDVVEAFASVAGFPSQYPVLPVNLMMAAARVCEASSVLGFPSPIHPQRVMKLVESTRITPAWLQANGYAFSSDLRGGLASWCDETNGGFC